MEDGERVVITCHGSPSLSLHRRRRNAAKSGWGGMKDRIRLGAGRNAPIGPDASLKAICERISAGYERCSHRPGGPGRLTLGVRKAVLKGPDILSVVSYWGVALKSMKGKLDVGDPAGVVARRARSELGATPLAFRAEHVGEVYLRPSIHRDPFDRILIAQAEIFSHKFSK